MFEVHLERFEGPLSLLLYLIEKNNLDIFDIPISKITQEYLASLERERLLRAEIAGEFLTMAVTLMQIKARMLCPRVASTPDSADPRSELVSRLLLHRQFMKLSQQLSQRRQDMDAYVFRPAPVFETGQMTLLSGLDDLSKAFALVMREFEQTHGQSLAITMDAHPVEAKIEKIERMLLERATLPLVEIWSDETSKLGLIACFLAILELIKRSAVRVAQQGAFAEILLVKVLPS